MPKQKLKIAVFIDWFLPGYKAGGPITSISNLINHLNNEFEFFVITGDRDLQDVKPYPNVLLNTFLDRKLYKIIYITPENQNKNFYKKILEKNKFDVYYFNSLFSVNFTIVPYLFVKKKYSAKVILAPRGMLGEGALEIKPFKKKLFLFFTRQFGVFKKVIWHATNEFEKSNIQKTFGENVNIKVAQNFPTYQGEFMKHIKNDILKLVFYSRVSPKKNLDYALKILERVKTHTQIIFDIYGPIEDKFYWNKCLEIVNTLPKNILVKYKSALSPDSVLDKLKEYDFLFLPTKHENFGHAIFEAFVSGCPVIISNQTEWQNIHNIGIGWDIDLNKPEQFVQIIEYCSNISKPEYYQMSKNAYQFSVDFFKNHDFINSYKRMFNNE